SADGVRALYPNADITNAGAATAGDLLHGRFDIAAAARDLGYNPSLDIKAGAAAYAAWLENHDF
ncbi:MAG: NAD(P)-dependent oxidoreductase, partial [Alphaproteobacteria bacterium]|nr:NAD(P)-dependent oxidoreductase [Alphaproteobacteria bacterium]